MNYYAPLCSNLVFHRERDKKLAESYILKHINQASSLILSRLGPTNLYLSGSLARQEPSVSVAPSGETTLRSDIDFVLVGYHARQQVADLEAELQMSFPEFADTLYLFEPSQVASLKSASARDLSLGMSRPIYEVEAVEAPNVKKIEDHYGLEFLCYQIIASAQKDAPRLERSGQAARTDEYIAVKVFVESIRSLTGNEPSPLTFQAAFTMLNNGKFDSIADRKIIEEAMRCRELGLPLTPRCKAVTQQVVFNALRELAKCESHSVIQLLHRIKEQFYHTDRLLHLYPLLALHIYFSESSLPQEPELAEAARRLEIQAQREIFRETGIKPPPGKALEIGRSIYFHQLIEMKDQGLDTVKAN